MTSRTTGEQQSVRESVGFRSGSEVGTGSSYDTY
jgi:hypothetical protein